MYKQRVNYVIIGVFVTAMVIASAATVALLTGRTGPTERTSSCSATSPT